MKKKIFSGLALLSLAIGGFAIQNLTGSSQKNDNILTSNIEALSEDEVVIGWIVTIYTPSHWDCNPGGGMSCPGTPW